MMHELYETCYRKFGYEWKIMTLKKKKKDSSHVWNMCDETRKDEVIAN